MTSSTTKTAMPPRSGVTRNGSQPRHRRHRLRQGICGPMSRTLGYVIDGPPSAGIALPESVAEPEELRAENARLMRLLKLSGGEAAVADPAQSGLFVAPPGPAHIGSPAEAKVALFGDLSAGRTDIFACSGWA
jgi:hypothetical protein